MSQLAAAFENFLRYQTAADLLPWLLALTPAESKAVQPLVKKIGEKLDLELDKTPHKNWEYARCLTGPQQEMLLLTALATWDLGQVRGRLFLTMFHLFGKSHENGRSIWATTTHITEAQEFQDRILTVLARRPVPWLEGWLASSFFPEWTSPAYWLLRGLEQRGALAPKPALLARAVSRYPLQGFGSHSAAGPFELAAFEAAVPERFRNDEVALRRDIPLLFEYDSLVETVQFSSSQLPGTIWFAIFKALVQSGHLDRDELLSRCLLALRRDGHRRPLQQWYQQLFQALQPTVPERLRHQTELLDLLAHPRPLVVNHAIDQLRELWVHPDFQAVGLLPYAEALLTRTDIKTSLKILLAGLGQLLKERPAQAPAVAQLYALALAQPDADIQQRAAKALAGLLGARPAVLSTAAGPEVVAMVQTYAPLLGPATRNILSNWLIIKGESTTVLPAATVAYAPLAAFVPELSDATAVRPVANWQELLFLSGEAWQLRAPLALERWLDGILRLQGQLPANYGELLQHNGPLGHGDLSWRVRELAHAWLRPQLEVQVETQPYWYMAAYHSDALAYVQQLRLVLVERRLRAGITLPLLSTPSHAPHWLAPSTLLARLLAYEAAGQEPNAMDLAVALARLAFAHPADAAVARTQLPQLRHEGLRELLDWLLAPADTPLPGAASAGPLHMPAAYYPERYAPPRAPVAPAMVTEALPALWMVAARTKLPANDFPELAILTPRPVPNLSQPWHPQWQRQPESPYGMELPWHPGPAHGEPWPTLHDAVVTLAPSLAMLYALHPSFHPTLRSFAYNYLWPLADDYPFLAGLVPHYPAPLHWHTIRLVTLDHIPLARISVLLTAALHSLLPVGPVLDEPGTLLLALGLAHGSGEVRALALEALLAAVAHRRLVPATLGTTLARLLGPEGLPVARPAEALGKASGLNSLTDQSLHQTLEALLPALPVAPPRGTRLLLDLYAALLDRAPHPLPEAVAARLREWQAVGSLKKLATALLQ